jgi:hypothetical protein
MKMKYKVLILDNQSDLPDLKKCEILSADSLPLFSYANSDYNSTPIGEATVSQDENTLMAEISFFENLEPSLVAYYKTLTPNIGVKVLETEELESGSVQATKIEVVRVFLDIGHIDNRIQSLQDQERAVNVK